ncbi:MAG: SpoIIE family protein phosphatase [Chloroherpetonaceae bacterium]|nr:SpoIIE family protein phosphatase [Chloroherpetonaceae bacterium]MDW8438037.1 SpoIIE family protein phosphatase [Chloroherpetonaceae bacterium]
MHGSASPPEQENMALYYFERARILAEELGAKDLLYQAHQAFAEEYERIGDIEKAYYHFKKYHEIERQVFNEESDRKTKNLQIIHQVEQAKKEAEIHRLRNVELAELNANITASIAYAQKIQQAILPSAEKISAAFPRHFIIYKPKDIVSGDFYWFHDLGDSRIVAVCDCTGHGVPGAFMSMIGNALLNQIVIEKGFTAPSVILEELHKSIRAALKQSDNPSVELQDGMDVCLARIESDKIIFAGAKRPLYAVQNDELIELKGDRYSIGGRQRETERKFAQRELPLETTTTLYLTTDGYIDQANSQRESFGSKRFKDLLKAISSLDVEEQKTKLDSELSLHQQNEAQRDDITLMGIVIGG